MQFESHLGGVGGDTDPQKFSIWAFKTPPPPPFIQWLFMDEM